MKGIIEYIQQRSREFEERPLFRYLRDESVDPTVRLRFVPCAAHFVMTFADLYHFFLREEPAQDRYQELVNIHLSEEGTHWKWYLADLTNLDLDPKLAFTDALRFVWGDQTLRTRRLAYEICKLSAGMSSLEKLVLVQSIEATGRVALEAAVPAGSAAARRMGRNLVYFGDHHLETEQQHTLEEADIHASLMAVEVSDAERRELEAIVDRVFEHFDGFIEDAFAFAKSGQTIATAASAAAIAATASA